MHNFVKSLCIYIELRSKSFSLSSNKLRKEKCIFDVIFVCIMKSFFANSSKNGDTCPNFWQSCSLIARKLELSLKIFR